MRGDANPCQLFSPEPSFLSVRLSSDGGSRARVQYCLAARRLITAIVRRNTQSSEAWFNVSKTKSYGGNGVEGQKSYWESFHGDVTLSQGPQGQSGSGPAGGAHFASTFSGSNP